MYKRFQGQQQWNATCKKWQLLKNVALLNSNLAASTRVSTPGQTLERARAWSKSFENLMGSDIGRQLFTKFLESEYSDENMLFWNACETVRKESSCLRKLNMMKDVFNMFVAASAPLEVNIESKVRDDLIKRLNESDVRAFERAQESVYLLMKRDCFARFIKSPVYVKFVKHLEQAAESSGLVQ